MGIVKKQGLLDSIFAYVGVGLGFLNVVILFPSLFETNEFGLTRVLIAMASLYAQFASLGVNKTVQKFFPLFRTEDGGHRGLMVIGLGVPLFGFAVFTLLFILFKDAILEVDEFKNKSDLLADNYLFAIPLSFLMLYNTVFEGFLHNLYKTAFTNFLRNVLQRLMVTMNIGLFWLGLVDFNTFLILFVYSYIVETLVLCIYLIRKKQFSLRPDKAYLRYRILKRMLNYGFFSILSGVSYMLVNRIDTIMIGFIVGLSETGVYSVAMYVTSVIYIPAQAVNRISFPIISSSWKSKKYDQIEDMYRRSSINLLLIGGGLLALIWVNVHNLFQLMKPEYAEGTWVVLIIGLARWFDMTTGINGSIIMASKHYRFDFIASVSLGITAVGANYLLIPQMGINGAALATLISLFVYNFVKFLFIWIKMGIQPFNYKSLLGVFIIGLSVFATRLIPVIDNVVFDTIVRTAAVGTIGLPLIFLFKVSDDFQHVVVSNFKKLVKKGS